MSTGKTGFGGDASVGAATAKEHNIVGMAIGKKAESCRNFNKNCCLVFLYSEEAHRVSKMIIIWRTINTKDTLWLYSC